jgi:CubicO group peptidase (beta-lactamase class C family)
LPRTEALAAARARALVDRGRTLAISIAIVDGAHIAWEAGFGQARSGSPADAGTVYRVGSLAKPVLAAAVLQRVEAGTWALDDPLAEHLEGLDSQATLRDVLTHRSGLPADDLALAWAGPKAPWRSLPERIRDRGSAPPGRALAYSNVAFTLLGRALELDVGAPFEEHVREAIFEPLGMAAAAYGAPAAGSAVPLGDEHDAGLVPAAGLTASAHDMARFLAMVLGGGRVGDRRVLEAGSIAEMVRIQNGGSSLDFRTRVGLGWQRDPPRLASLAPVIWHDGQVPGHRAVMVGLPRHGLGIVVLATTVTDPEEVTELAFEVLERAAAERGIAVDQSPRRGATPRLVPLENPTGTFMMQNAVAEITRIEGGVRVEPATALAPQLPMPTASTDDPGRLDHVRDQTYRRSRDGLVIHFVRRHGVDLIVGERDGYFGRLGERVEHSTIPAAWRARVGTWVPAAKGWYGFERVELAVGDGYLTLAHDASWDDVGDERTQLALVPTDDAHAVVAGIGRGKGETISAGRDAQGPILRWQGLDLRLAGD